MRTALILYLALSAVFLAGPGPGAVGLDGSEAATNAEPASATNGTIVLDAMSRGAVRFFFHVENGSEVRFNFNSSTMPEEGAGWNPIAQLLALYFEDTPHLYSFTQFSFGPDDAVRFQAAGQEIATNYSIDPGSGSMWSAWGFHFGVGEYELYFAYPESRGSLQYELHLDSPLDYATIEVRPDTVTTIRDPSATAAIALSGPWVDAAVGVARSERVEVNGPSSAFAVPNRNGQLRVGATCTTPDDTPCSGFSRSESAGAYELVRTASARLERPRWAQLIVLDLAEVDHAT